MNTELFVNAKNTLNFRALRYLALVHNTTYELMSRTCITSFNAGLKLQVIKAISNCTFH